MKIKYYQIDREFNRISKNFLKDIIKISKEGNFILGKYVSKFEKKISKLLNSKYVLGVGNGTDALEIALRTLNIGYGDEVITAPNSFISTANAIINVGAKPVFVDIDETYNIDPDLIEKAITKRTKAIMPVHLNGFPACMKKIKDIARKKKLFLIEDAAQSILSRFGNNYTGTIGDIGCFSLHPTKNLGAIGDGGFLVINKLSNYKKARLIRNHGIVNADKTNFIGVNSRLDEIQAAALIHKIKYLKKDIKRRNEIASYYNQQLSFLNKFIILPKFECCKSAYHTYHRYVIRCKKRDNLLNYLKNKNIDVKIHYKKNIIDQKPIQKIIKRKKFKNTNSFSKEMLSLPINQFMSFTQMAYVVNSIKSFYLK